MPSLNILGIGVISWLIFLPVVGMILILALPKSFTKYYKYITVVFTFLLCLVALFALMNYDTSKAGVNSIDSYQFVEKVPWINLNVANFRVYIEYFVAADGLSFPMIILTALIGLIGAIASFSIDKNEKGYYSLYLLLVTGMMGVFCALDLFLFFVFWEVMLLPMYFLIGIWGGPRREYAAIKFFLYTLFGSVFILITIIALYFSSRDPVTGIYTFNMVTMMNPANLPNWPLALNYTDLRLLAFVALFIGFAIKVPVFPFHTWLPDAHVEAPTAISVILAGVLLKMGTYGMFRMSYALFPDAAKYFALWIAVLAMINIIYGALCAMAQTDFKKLIAYSSISHMGYVMLGMASMTEIGFNGAIFQMFNHGTITAVLFLAVGVIYDRTHTRGLDDFGGLANKMPKYFGVVMVGFFASIGLPGLSAFISEAFVFIGAFTNNTGPYEVTMRVITIISTLGIILNAAYILWTIQRVFLGTLPEKWSSLKDLNVREAFSLVPLIIIIIVLGIYPAPFIKLMTASVNQLLGIIAKF